VSGGAIAGIVVGVVVALAAATVVSILVLRHFGYLGGSRALSSGSTGTPYNRF
jgi:hypothetical protein